MKTFSWTDDLAPGFTRTPDGGLIFNSHPELYNYEPGDRIEYKTRLGVTVFEIIFIESANLKNYDPELQRIIAKRI